MTELPDFRLTEEQEFLWKSAERVGAEVYAPLAGAWDRDATPLPESERRRLADLGFLGMALPESLGGGGASLLDALLVVEAIAKHNAVAGFQVFESNTGPIRVIDLFGTEEQKARFIPPVTRGEATMAIAISEPDAGSAATDLSTTGRVVGDEIILNGTKRWSSGAGRAELYLVYVRLEDTPGHRGIGAVVVEHDTPGVAFGPQESLMGFRGIGSADITFTDARVPLENLVVPAGEFKRLFSAFSIERLGNATMSLALAQAALDRTAAYVQERQQFGRPIVEFQAVQMLLADMIVKVEATRLLNWRAAARAGRGHPHPLEASVAKCHANEAAKRVTDAAIELHGGYGYHTDYGIERYHRDAHGWAIAGGSPSMQRTRIVSEYLGRRFAQRPVDWTEALSAPDPVGTA